MIKQGLHDADDARMLLRKLKQGLGVSNEDDDDSDDAEIAADMMMTQKSSMAGRTTIRMAKVASQLNQSKSPCLRRIGKKLNKFADHVRARYADGTLVASFG